VTAQADAIRHDTLWFCEKWSEEAVEFAQRKLERAGISHIPQAFGIQVAKLVPIKHGISSAVLRSIVGPAEECAEIKGNLLLNEGIQRLQDMTMIATPTTNQTATNPWSNANAFMGVGDTNTAEAATQTELLATAAAANRFYKAMNATYPSRSNQTVSFQSDFTTTEANFIWNEWTVAAATTGASGAGFLTGTTNLNRKVAALGTKSTGTWTLTGQITFS
jgi:hypothetical protein